MTLEVPGSLGCTSSIAQSTSIHGKHTSTASRKKRKSHLEPSVPQRAQKEQESTAKRRRPKPSLARANFSPQQKLRLPEKNTMFRANPNIQSASMMQNRKTVLQSRYLSTSVGAASPLRSAHTELQHAIELQRATVEHIAWMQQFHCRKHINTCKTQ